MALQIADVERVVGELRSLIGARIQKLWFDGCAMQIKFRKQGHVHFVWIVADQHLGRIHHVEHRQPLSASSPERQRYFRKHLESQMLCDLHVEAQQIVFRVSQGELAVRWRGGRDAFIWTEVQVPNVLHAEPAFSNLFPVSAEIHARYATFDGAGRVQALREREKLRLLRLFKKQKRLLVAVQNDHQRLLALSSAAHWGELLKVHMREMKRGSTQIKVLDWQNNAEVIIPLNPELSPQQNVESLFQKARRYKRGLAQVEARLLQVRTELSGYEDQLHKLDDPNWGTDLGAAESSAAEHVSSLPQKPNDPPRSVGRAQAKKAEKIALWAKRFRLSDGVDIFVGRGAKENDRLTFAFALGKDLWFHARDLTGAHVLLRCAHPDRLERAMQDAAQLALHYSSAKAAQSGEVMYTEARYVRKNKGMPAGAVAVSRCRTLWVVRDERRLAELRELMEDRNQKR